MHLVGCIQIDRIETLAQPMRQICLAHTFNLQDFLDSIQTFLLVYAKIHCFIVYPIVLSALFSNTPVFCRSEINILHVSFLIDLLINQHTKTKYSLYKLHNGTYM